MLKVPVAESRHLSTFASTLLPHPVRHLRDRDPGRKRAAHLGRGPRQAAPVVNRDRSAVVCGSVGCATGLLALNLVPSVPRVRKLGRNHNLRPETLHHIALRAMARDADKTLAEPP